MKYLAMFTNMRTLFPRKVIVTLIDATSNQMISQRKVLINELPELFDRPTVLTFDGVAWQVLAAKPVSAEDFHFTKKLTLHVQRQAEFAVSNTRSLIPTVAGEVPAAGEASSPILLSVSPAQWAQLQFLPVAESPLVEEQLAVVNTLMKSGNPLIGYEEVFTRPPMPALQIPFSAFCDSISVVVSGSVDGITHSIALRSESHTYYGVVSGEMITSLCLQEFEFVDDELSNVLEQFGLMLVDWCDGQAISLQ
jgi:hypothetical protein